MQYNNKVIDQPAIKRLLPTMTLHADCRKDNLVSELLKRTGNIDFKDFYVDLTTSPETGVNGHAYIHNLNYDSILIDTISLRLTQKGERLTYQAQVRNNRKNPQFVFNALIDGHVHEHGAVAGLRYYDEKERMGVRIGATAEMEEGGIRLRLMPDRPTVGYKEFYEPLPDNGNPSAPHTIADWIKLNTWHYARKQRTWFRRIEN